VSVNNFLFVNIVKIFSFMPMIKVAISSSRT